MKKLFLLHKQNFKPNINPGLLSAGQNLVYVNMLITSPCLC